MTHLRQLMLEELHRRDFAGTTFRTYLHSVAHFSQYFRRPPDQLGPEEIRKYQATLFTTFKFSPNTVILRLAALRCFYIHVLKRGWSKGELLEDAFQQRHQPALANTRRASTTSHCVTSATALMW